MRILIAIKGFLGDTILSTPLFAAIHRRHPQAQLYLLTKAGSAEIVQHDPLLSEVIIYDRDDGLTGLLRLAQQLREHRFDKVYSVHRAHRTSILLFLAGIRERIGFSDAHLSFLYTSRIRRCQKQHEVLRNLAILGEKINDSDPITQLRLFPPGSQEVSPILKQITTKKPLAILVPGSVWPTKRWHWQGYQQVADYLLKRSWQVALIGAPNEADISNRIGTGLDLLNLTGKLTVLESIWLCKQGQLMVCNDSMALHMASALKLPTVAIFCATSEQFGFGPWQNSAIVVEKEGLKCKPCARHGTKVCPNGTEACMNDLEASQVIRAIEQLLGEKL